MRNAQSLIKRIPALLLAVFLLASALPAAAGAAEPEQKTVRVGWFDSSFCYWDEFGRRCGIDFEYQHRISAYTGWTYEYVEDSWPNLLQKLKDGEIDLLSDVSYKPDREEFMFFPDLPMGTESYYIYISADNREITADRIDSFHGKKIGVNQGSVQEGFLREWAEKYNVAIEIVPLVTGEDESMDMVTSGRLDGYASIYSFSSEQKVVPISRVGSSDYFYAVNKQRPDLLAELNMALAGIRDEDPYFNERLSEERIYSTRTNASLTPSEDDWLHSHGTIRVGYPENFLPFCQTDSETGELTGALKDFLSHAQNSLSDRHIQFQTLPFPTITAAMEAMKAGEVDCVFPLHLNDYDAVQMGVRLSSPAMKTGVNAVIENTDNHSLSRDSQVSIAVTEGNPNVETFIREYYPRCRILTYPGESDCFRAVASGMADCALISNYQVPVFEDEIRQIGLFSVPTGEHIPFSFAVQSNERDLYFLLNKMVLVTDSSDMDSALASYMHSSRKVSFAQFLKDNLLLTLGFLTLVFAVIVFLLLQRLKAQRKAHQQQALLEEAAEVLELKKTITSLLDNMPGMTFTKDAETGVYLACNQAFAEYAHQKSPDEVIGRRDTELFDEETAKRLTADDRMALSMDGPYIFFEDATDDSGNRRQVRVTKLKYTDANGRLCVLGISQDAMDSFRIRRGSVASREDYEKAKGAGIVYTHIAQALARGFSALFYVDLNTEQFIGYRWEDEGNTLAETQRGWHFFEQCQEAADENVYPDDLSAVKKAMERKNLISALDADHSILMTFRLIRNAVPRFVTLRVTRMMDDDRYIVLAFMDVDEQTKLRRAALRVSEEHLAYNRLSALAGDFLSVYVVDPGTGSYRELSASSEFSVVAHMKEGKDFFADFRDQSRILVYPEDRNRVLPLLTLENILAEIERRGMFTLSYRLMIGGAPHYVRMKGVRVEEKDGRPLILGFNDIDAQVQQEEDYVRNMTQAQLDANIDPLTGVKNRHAYLVAEDRLNLQISENPSSEFAITILDVNDLKKINDRDGHSAGDLYLQEACRIICRVFKHSPVFRVGGDEFVVISQGDDYERMDDLVREIRSLNEQALKTGGVVIACGMARHEGESTASEVFERADQRMYEDKNELKNR